VGQPAIVVEEVDEHGPHADGLQSPYGFINYFLNTDRKQWPSAPGTAFMHNGNGLNMVYVDPENELVAVVRWIDNNAVDGFLKRLIAAVAEKS